LLTASAFWFTKADNIQQTAEARSGVSIVLIILIFALFLIDRAHEIFLRAAVGRAIQIERWFGNVRLTNKITVAADKTHIVTWAAILYTLFLAANPDFLDWLRLQWRSGMFARAYMWLTTAAFSDPFRPVIFVTQQRLTVIVTLTVIVVLWLYHAWTWWHFPEVDLIS
jgi:hypothetical protein